VLRGRTDSGSQFVNISNLWILTGSKSSRIFTGHWGNLDENLSERWDMIPNVRRNDCWKVRAVSQKFRSAVSSKPRRYNLEMSPWRIWMSYLCKWQLVGLGKVKKRQKDLHHLAGAAVLELDSLLQEQEVEWLSQLLQCCWLSLKITCNSKIGWWGQWIIFAAPFVISSMNSQSTITVGVGSIKLLSFVEKTRRSAANGIVWFALEMLMIKVR
jgi:hypothetical protein